MQFGIFQYVDHRNVRPVEGWLDAAESRTRGKLDAKIRMLRQFGGGLPKSVLSDTDHPLIKKLRCTGRTNPRLMVTRGPQSVHTEFTLLLGVYEKDNKMPAGAVEKAAAYRVEIAADASRRTAYVPPKP